MMIREREKARCGGRGRWGEETEGEEREEKEERGAQARQPETQVKGSGSYKARL